MIEEETQLEEVTEELTEDVQVESDPQPELELEASPEDVTETPVTESPSEVEETEVFITSPASVSDISTSLLSTSEDELLRSVHQIEEIEIYKFGFLLVGTAIFLSVVMIKTFFGKGG